MGDSSGVKKTDQVLHAASQDVATTKEELMGRIKTLRGRLEALNGQWEGRGQVAFQGAIESWQNTADRVIGAMDSFKANLDGSESTYDESEDIVAGGLNRYQNGLAG